MFTRVLFPTSLRPRAYVSIRQHKCLQTPQRHVGHPLYSLKTRQDALNKHCMLTYAAATQRMDGIRCVGRSLKSRQEALNRSKDNALSY